MTPPYRRAFGEPMFTLENGSSLELLTQQVGLIQLSEKSLLFGHGGPLSSATFRRRKTAADVLTRAADNPAEVRRGLVQSRGRFGKNQPTNGRWRMWSSPPASCAAARRQSSPISRFPQS